jgi:hypothetical protein
LIYQSLVDAVPVIRNEELILLYAEANMLSNPFEARRAINVVRNAANLGTYRSANSYSFRKRNSFNEDILYLAKVIDGLI